jgi:hypothetical protein
MKTLTLIDIPQDQLQAFIAKMDGYHGISLIDKSWINDQESTAYKLTLFCYLISQGILFVKDQKLKSSVDGGYEDLIDFIHEYFKGKCIISFTDLFFLEDINEAFCSGKWYNVDESWLRDREDYLDILENRKPQIYREPTAYAVVVDNDEDFYDMIQYVYRGKKNTVILDFLDNRILWREVDYSSTQFKKDFNLMNARVTYNEISLIEWQHRYIEFFGREIPLLN